MLAVRDLDNLGPIQKQMLQYKDLFAFLNKHVSQKAGEIINGYIVNTSSLYLAHFRGFVVFRPCADGTAQGILCRLKSFPSQICG
jgi:hypothetical protein